jgi:hypothetical protein
MFVVAFAGAFLAWYAFISSRRPARPSLTVWTVAVDFGAVIAVVSGMAALDLGSSDSNAAAGCGVGVLAGQWLGALRGRSPG